MKVYFVGAGPGDPDLLTRKAERLLRRAQVCIYAGSLVSPMVLALLPAAARSYNSAGLTLEETIAIMLQARDADQDVVRLHTGDPSLYSATAEQMAALERHGMVYEVVPGVSAFQAAAATLGWELTLPETTQSVVLTRTPGRTPMPAGETLARFGRSGATLCLYLSAHTIAETAATLAAHYGRDCPAAVVYRASWPDERIVRGTLADIAAKTRAAGITKTALILVRPAPVQPACSRLYDADFSHGAREGRTS
ncbi:precorrin-4 C(11)-methyltransferase [Desulfatitalea alkaliphila]|uniref:Precorrin-4 C(11)-methyltransferase n=1 Tax=Desulfatitalea alkaliphila TaxID=2929485 RepID=A0AA41R0M4_9BACT|nr:precorrin-4 C(11)-methyltransferase [Desulfatitalea alkaliphila]MCJ8499942.1 precorrin-4 C(11)-methyltransferase [Desulfatitalea alkaliphila]